MKEAVTDLDVMQKSNSRLYLTWDLYSLFIFISNTKLSYSTVSSTVGLSVPWVSKLSKSIQKTLLHGLPGA